MRRTPSRTDPIPLPDETLVERTVAGDHDALASLLDRHDRVLRARIGRVLADPLRRKVSVSDVLQEVRIASFRTCATFVPRGAGSVRAWLLRIAELKAYETVRRFAGVAKRDAGREVTQGGRPDTDQLPGCGRSPSAMAMAGEAQQEVRAAMATLPDVYREVLQLVGVKGLSFADVGARMHRSNEAVRKLYARALSAFTEALKSARGDAGDE